MITLKEYFETINYRITEGYAYQWQCYGPNAYGLESCDGFDSPSSGIVFDTKDQTVYQVEVHDYKNKRSYRMVNPLYAEALAVECVSRGMDDVAYDGVEFTDLETVEDFIEKATAILNGKEYDTRISIPIDLPDNMLLTLMKQAHEQDITFNDHMENVLTDAIKLLGEKHGVNS